MVRSTEEEEKWQQGRRDGFNGDLDTKLNSNIIYRDGWRQGMLSSIQGEKLK